MAWYWWVAIAVAVLLVGGFAFASCGVGRRPAATTSATTVVSAQNPEEAMDGITRVYSEYRAKGKKLDEFRNEIFIGSTLEKRVEALEETDKDYMRMLNCLRGDCGSRTAVVAIPCGAIAQPCPPAPAPPARPKQPAVVVPAAPQTLISAQLLPPSTNLHL